MPPKKTTTHMTDAAIKQLIAQGIADALADYEANRSSGNGNNSHNSRSGERRTVKGTDVVSYTQRFQELALMCGRMFPEESDQVEKYVGGIPDMIQGSVMASKPKTMQETIKFAIDLMDQKIRTFAERQAENKRNLDDNTRNNQTQQQPFKRIPAAANNQRAPGQFRSILKECHVLLTQITKKKAEDKSEDKRLKDAPIVRDFPEVFPEDFSGVPPTRQVEF
ncbi:hypothetical protein Tco_0914329 [Tanacetum coccineum]